MEKMEKDRAEEILQSLTIDQKIRLLNGVGSWNTYDADGKIPVISMSDGPHGLRHQTGEESYANINDSRKATCFPTASAIACSWNVEALEKMGAAIAKEALEEKVQLMLGCGMNIKRSPLCGRNFEYFSEDPYLSGELATAYVNGMQKEGESKRIMVTIWSDKEEEEEIRLKEKKWYQFYLFKGRIVKNEMRLENQWKSAIIKMDDGIKLPDDFEEREE